jgi:hypothetical protein
MRHTVLGITFLVATGLTVGCASRTAEAPGETAAAKRDKVRTETKEAAQATQDYLYTQKAEFVAKMKKELMETQHELDQLTAKVETLNGTAKAEAKTQLEALAKKWAQAEKLLKQAESATEPTWNDVKAGVKQSYGDLRESFDSTRQWLSEKIAP